MAYQVKFTETTNPSKPPLTVEDQNLNHQTSLTFVGKNYPGYGSHIAENFLHLLENFSNTTPPSNPVEGQLWYDNSLNLLKIYDGTTWAPTGSIKKATSAPTLTNTQGDIWVDTSKNQLYISSGSTWLLVGPQYSSGIKTGPEIETITDIENVDHAVTTIFSEDQRIAIISKSAFTPKSTILGFSTINQGVNLSSVDSTSTSAPTKFWGRASEADALNIAGVTVPSLNFLRGDKPSVTNESLSIRSKNGLIIGSDLSFSMTTDAATVFYSKNSGKNINFKVNHAGDAELNAGEYIALSIGSNTKIGLGPNNINPQATLDVFGDVRTDGIVKIDDVTDATVVGSASLTTEGGLSVNKKSYLGDNIVTYGSITLNKLTDRLSGTPLISESVLIPGANVAYDIGSSALRFRNVWAQTFNGHLEGTFSGQLTGSLEGTATRLASSTVFKIRGDVTSSPDVSFNGETIDGTATFNTVIGPDLIKAKSEVTDSFDTDFLLIYRGGNIGSGLKKTSKLSFISNIPTVPIGTIFPYAGSTPPVGYLFCDGGEVPIASYNKLFEIIGYTYRPASSLSGQASFALPDLRGRFALGRDNMDNGTTIPDKNSPTVPIDAGGGAANNVTSVVADTLGAASGDEQVVLGITNLPDHKHNLSSSAAQYYAVGVPGVVDTNGLPNRGLPSGAIDGYGLPNSGSVISTSLAQPLNVMNPYLTINYIIFTGVIQ